MLLTHIPVAVALLSVITSAVPVVHETREALQAYGQHTDDNNNHKGPGGGDVKRTLMRAYDQHTTSNVGKREARQAYGQHTDDGNNSCEVTIETPHVGGQPTGTISHKREALQAYGQHTDDEDPKKGKKPPTPQ